MAREHLVYVVLATVLMAGQPFAVEFTQNEDGEYDYLILSVSAMSELVKLVASVNAYFVLIPFEEHSHRLLSRRDILRFCIPAVAFAVNNALMFLIVSEIRPSLFQLVSTTKTIFTALLFRIIIKRLLTPTHYAAIVLLAIGTAVSRLPTCDLDWALREGGSHGSGYDGYNGAFEDEVTDVSHESLGVLLTLFTCILSSLGGVLNELLLKRDGQVHSLFLQNALLYAWGVLLNSVALWSLHYKRILNEKDGIFVGYNRRVALLIAVNAVMGLSISVILKHLNNLVRVICHTCAMMVSMLLDALILQEPPQRPFLFAIGIVACSSIIYSLQPTPKPMHQQPTLVRN
tara:strand:- start:2198 stop:3232 length:1035 start_codon:yes stop_codon:yes gene_type:complete